MAAARNVCHVDYLHNGRIARHSVPVRAFAQIGIEIYCINHPNGIAATRAKRDRCGAIWRRKRSATTGLPVLNA